MRIKRTIQSPVGLGGILAAVTLLVSCDPGRETTGQAVPDITIPTMMIDREIYWQAIVTPADCYSDTYTLGANPHVTERVPGQHPGSEYCLEFDDDGVLWLRPVARLDWQSCEDEDRIRLTHHAGLHYFFCARVPDHMGNHDQDHHGMGITIHPGAGGSKLAVITGGPVCPPTDPNYPNCEQHGGSAHSLN